MALCIEIIGTEAFLGLGSSTMRPCVKGSSYGLKSDADQTIRQYDGQHR
jgi:hypothetical protein